ncbi:MAG: inovirus-type Gp2 protein [Colwellia sp.]
MKTDQYIYKEYVWQVCHEALGLIEKFMDRIFEQFDIMLERYSRVFVVRFDLHLKEYGSNNKVISDYLKGLLIKLKSKYKCQIAHAWSRECYQAEAQHYHCSLMLSGHNIRHPDSLLEEATKLWKEQTNGYLFKPENCYYMAKRGVSQLAQQIIYRLSYLAKKRTKGKRDNHAKDYQTSRLKPKNKSFDNCYLVNDPT